MGSRELERARRVVGRWAVPASRGEPDLDTRQELARIERAILHGAVHVFEELGDFHAAPKRCGEPERQVRRRGGRASIDRGGVWRTERLARVCFR